MPANTPRLETERLVLRRFTPADVEPLFSLMRDREVNTFLPWFPLETEADAARYLEEHYLDYYRRPSGCRYAICLREKRPPHRATSMWTTGRAMIWATPWPGHPGAAAT